jgi:hypothetical protein
MRLSIILAVSLFSCVVITSQTAGQAPRAMSFQGYLTDTLGAPIVGPQTVSFRLYDAKSAGTLAWSRTYPGATVNDGVFSIILENGTPSFDGVSFDDSLWVQVEVGAEVLSQRTLLTASAYTMGLSLPIEATLKGTGGPAAALKIVNTATTGVRSGIEGQNSSSSGSGVIGLATATSGAARGVFAQSDANGGVGAYGYATSPSGPNFGVVGETFSDEGTGVFGRANTTTGTTYGVLGESASSTGRGVYGRSTRTSGTTYGVYGRSSSSGGIGVFGWATRSFGATYGVQGRVSSPEGWSGYFDGGQGTYTISADNNNPDLVLGGSSAGTDDGIIGTDAAYASSDLWFYTNDAVIIRLDYDGDGEDSDFEIRNSANVNIFNVDESGSVTSAGTANHGSDRNRKEAIVAIDAQDVLEEVVRLPISRWRYKGESVPHVGPMAQDFYSSFRVGADDRHIAAVDADGVALAAIQGLYELVQELKAENERMRAAMARAGIE